MKNTFKTFTTALTLVVISAALAACSTTGSSGGETPKAVSIIVTNTSEREAPIINEQGLSNLVMETIQSEGYLNVINSDGNPEIVIDGSFTQDETHKGASKTKTKADARNMTATIMNQISELRADDPEIDTLKSLIKASNSLQKHADYEKTIVIFDTGLSTTGELDFKNNLINAEPEVIADLLEERACIPNLTDITIVWYRVNASGEQVITEKQYSQIENIWRSIVQRGKGTLEWYNDCSIKRVADTSGELPHVSVVDLPETTPIRFAKTAFESSSPFEEAQFLSEDQVTFIPDSAEYLYPDKVEDTLQPIADYLKSNPETSILLAGTIAGDSCSDSGLKLSYDRADAVKNSLVSLGVSDQQIVAIGLGCSDPWHIYGVGFDGEAAKQNRKVVIIDKESQISKEILSTH